MPMTSYSVPFFSQLADVRTRAWRYRGCGVVSLKMVLEYWHLRDRRNQSPAIAELLAKGLDIGAYLDAVGWIHSGLVAVARQFGYDGFNRDHADLSLTPLLSREAFEHLEKDLKRGPLLASVYSGFDPDKGGGHIVVVVAVHDGLVEINDPADMKEREGRKAFAVEAFLKAWKRRYIAVYPAS